MSLEDIHDKNDTATMKAQSSSSSSASKSTSTPAKATNSSGSPDDRNTKAATTTSSNKGSVDTSTPNKGNGGGLASSFDSGTPNKGNQDTTANGGVNAAARQQNTTLNRLGGLDNAVVHGSVTDWLNGGAFPAPTTSQLRAEIDRAKQQPYSAEFVPSSADVADMYSGIIAPQGGLYKPGPPVMLPPQGLRAATAFTSEEHLKSNAAPKVDPYDPAGRSTDPAMQWADLQDLLGSSDTSNGLWGQPGAPIALSQYLSSGRPNTVGQDPISQFIAGAFGPQPNADTRLLASGNAGVRTGAGIDGAATIRRPATVPGDAPYIDATDPIDVASLGLTTDPFRSTPSVAAIDAAAGSNPLWGTPGAPISLAYAIPPAQGSSPGVPLPRRDPRGYGDVFATDGQVTTPDGSVITPGSPLQVGYNGGVVGKHPEAPSKWDNVVDNTGKLLSHTGLGSIVSTLFPDQWNGMGDAFKGLDNGGGGGQPIDNTAFANLINGGGGDPFMPQRHGDDGGDGSIVQAAVAAAFLDVNGNGIDDRLEGVGATDTLGGNQFRSNRGAVFPDMPPYRPGVDNEWDYFHDHLARGGVVGYADGGQVALAGPDPRVMAIADAEDALHAGRADDPAVAKFVSLFGPSALKQLEGHVGAGYSMRPRGRMVTGPGGPTDDAVPAVIDGVHPAKLSSGEFVLPVSAVEGIGGGDPKVGADRLHALVARFAQ